MTSALAFFTEVKPAPINLPPQFLPFIFDSGVSCTMVNSLWYGKGWQGTDVSGCAPETRLGVSNWYWWDQLSKIYLVCFD